MSKLRVTGPVFITSSIHCLCVRLVYSKASTYADDSGTGVKGNSIAEIIPKLEEDGENVLKYMASNGLVANPSKTALLFINN